MDEERWRKIKEIFNEVVELPLNRQESVLAEVCKGDEKLRKEVISLLISDRLADSFIEESVVDVAVQVSKRTDNENFLGQRFGAYRVEKEIGKGGMGAVFLAERVDDEFNKKVAIKLLRFGLETDQTIERFRRERQILAELEHPNIAHLLDGGTMPGGLPYYVMEYIEGKPIDDYCDIHKLTVNQRLKLFLGVCNAVNYAHQNHIVHRDIKPGNILVLDDGTPKLLDFGIAKLLDAEFSPQSLKQTATAWRLMTPDYASPEQIKGEEITESTDIYSLGVLLYELLTGHLPYRLKNHFIYEIARAICEQEPEKPSASVNRTEEIITEDGILTITPEKVSLTREGQPEKLRRRLKGDLDHIVLMALRKEPEKRYSTVEKFSTDIDRYLKGLPIISRNGSLAYIAGKFLKRNKVRIATAVFGLIMLITGSIIATRQYNIAETERLKRADAEAEKERQFALLNPDYIRIKDSPSLNPQRGITISLWYKSKPSVYDQNLVTKLLGNDDSFVGDSYNIYLTASSVFAWETITTEKGELFQDWAIYEKPNILDDRFHHLVATYDSDSEESKVYCDGVLLKGRRSSFLPKKKGKLLAVSNTDLLFGAGSNGNENAYFFRGVLDEVQIYDRAISESEVQMLRTSPADAQFSGLISWWRGEGNCLDSFGNNHGEFIGEAKYENGVVGQAFSFGK